VEEKDFEVGKYYWYNGFGHPAIARINKIDGDRISVTIFEPGTCMVNSCGMSGPFFLNMLGEEVPPEQLVSEHIDANYRLNEFFSW
jgi:hypothetical protein